MTFIKNNYKYFLFFIFSVFMMCFLMYNDLSFDATWEYGMSHAITKGLLPYKDFNTITPPLFIFLFSIGLFIKDSFLVFLLEFCIIYLVMYYFLDKLLGKNSIYILIGMGLILFRAYIPSYNAISFVFIVILMCLEKYKSNDKLIGLISALLILTKHTIGIPIFILSCIGIWNKEKIKNRLFGLIGPIVIFCFYLLITNSYKEFFDLCFLGLISFGGKNTVSFSFTYVLAGIILVLTLWSILKDRKNILFYYALGSIMFIIPICDLSHITYFISVFSIAILDKFNTKIDTIFFTYVIFLLIVGSNLLIREDFYKNAKVSDFPHYEYTLIHKDGVKTTKRIIEKVSKYKDYTFIDNRGMYLDIVTDNKISYFSVPLYGNHGYDGTNKMIDRVKKSHNKYYLIDKKYYLKIKNKELLNEQLDIDLIKYVMDNSTYVDYVEPFSIYYKE